MTTTAERRLGHPVRSFLLVIVVTIAVLGAIQWSGATRPHLFVDQGQSGLTADQRHYVAALVHNTGRTAIRIEDVRFALDGWTDVDTAILADGTAPTEVGGAPRRVPHATLAASGSHGDATWVVVSGHPPCPGASRDIAVRVRTWSGIERSVLLPDGTGGPEPDARPAC